MISQIESRLKKVETSFHDIMRDNKKILEDLLSSGEAKESLAFINSKCQSFEDNMKQFAVFFRDSIAVMQGKVDARKQDNLDLITKTDSDLINIRKEFSDEIIRFDECIRKLNNELRVINRLIEDKLKIIVDQFLFIEKASEGFKSIVEGNTNEIKRLKDDQKGIAIFHEAQVNSLRGEIKDAASVIVSQFESKFTKHQAQVGSVLDKIKIPEYKNYDSEIDAIKQDISTILSLVHSTAINQPDTSKVNEKMKVMEQSIAQIYSLLKKYDHGS